MRNDGHAIGQVAGSLLLLTVVHTYKSEEVVRIISAREATKKGTNMLKEYSDEELFRRPLAPEQKAKILALLDKRDAEIDLSDIPEITEIPAGAVRGLFYRGNMIRLPEELRKYFADLAARRRVPMNDLVVETLQKALELAETVR